MPCRKMDGTWMMDRTEYEFYLDLRKYGTVPHGGFGIGIERMVTFAAGTKHIRECYSIPTYVAPYQTLIAIKTPSAFILFENQIQTTSASPCRTQVQPAASFLVCSLIFIEY